MSLINTGISALGRLTAIGLLLAAFVAGLAGVVYMSLQGSEIKVPEITGKNIYESEKELAALGLKIKKRSDRVSAELPNTVIEQLPKPGETVKTGQMILVVTSKGGGEAGAPASLQNTTDEEESEKIEELISEKPKKAKSNSNVTRKKADTARDVNAASGQGNSNSNSDSSDSNSTKKTPPTGTNTVDRPNRNTQPAGPRTNPLPPASRPAGDGRPRMSNRP